MKPFSDVWYKPLPWCQFHFGSSQMFWWVPVCRFNIPPMPEPSSPVIIVTACVLVRNARRWFWCNKRVGFFPCFSLKERERTVGIEALQAKAISTFVVADASYNVWLCCHWSALKAGVLSAQLVCCISSEKWKKQKFSIDREWVGRFLSEGLSQVEVENWMWSMLGLNTHGRKNTAMYDIWQWHCRSHHREIAFSCGEIAISVLGHRITIMERNGKCWCIPLGECYKAQYNCPCCSLARMSGLTLPPLSRNV